MILLFGQSALNVTVLSPSTTLRTGTAARLERSDSKGGQDPQETHQQLCASDVGNNLSCFSRPGVYPE